MFFACSKDDSTNTQEFKTSAKSFEAMNTFMTLKSYGPKSDAVNDSVASMIAGLEANLSTTKESSLIYKFNHDNSGEEKHITIPPEFANLFLFSLNMAQKTDGAFNPTLYPIVHLWGFTTEKYRVPSAPEIAEILTLTDFTKVTILEKDESGAATIQMKKGMMMDMGAVGKGFAGDRAIQMMKSKGITSAILDFGGNVQTLGCKSDGKPWKVGVTNPWGDAPLGGIAVCNKAVITSGGYERYFEQNGKRFIHIFDGHTGRPVENELASVTIVAESGLYADALSTSLFVMGKDKAIEFWKNNHESFQMILAMNDHTIAYTDGLKDVLTLTHQIKSKTIIQK